MKKRAEEVLKMRYITSIDECHMVKLKKVLVFARDAAHFILNSQKESACTDEQQTQSKIASLANELEHCSKDFFVNNRAEFVKELRQLSDGA